MTQSATPAFNRFEALSQRLGWVVLLLLGTPPVLRPLAAPALVSASPTRMMPQEGAQHGRA